MGLSHKEKTVEQRLKESTQILIKHPDRVCVFLERQHNSLTLPIIDNNKFLVPDSLTIAQFIYIVRKRIKVSAQQGLFFYVNNSLISGSQTILEISNKYKDVDGFLYVKYTSENCFG